VSKSVPKPMGIVAALAGAAGLAFALSPVAGALTDGSSGARAASSAQCTQLRKRLIGAPATLRRVDANLVELRARLAQVRVPVRRLVVEERIERLEQLRAALQSKITEARAACSTTGDNTT
jgi:uncharacterized protein YhaN